MRIRYLTAACALTIVILGLLTLAFSTYAKRALYVKQSPSSVNVALLSNGAGLEGRIFNGMASTLFNRRAIWDHAGKFAGGSQSAQPTISVSDVSVTEGNSGSVSAVFNITLSSASSNPITISYTTANGTATTPSDYTAASGTITFGPGATTTGISVPVIGDTTVEPNENFFLNLSNPINATINDGQGIGTILNDDTTPTPAISISDATVTEGNSGSVSAVFNITLSSASSQPITISYTTANGTATTPSDYTAASGTITFGPGATTTGISVPVIGDTTIEPNENFFLNLSSPINATINDGQGIGTILNDDTTPTPAISISDATVTEGNSGSVSAVFNVTLSSASSQPITISYTTANGTATTPSDYTAASGTITFGPGATTTGISVPVIGDTTVEPNENFFVNLSSPINATINDGQGIGTILNDDALPSISISDITINEGNSGTTSAVFNVTLSSASAQMIDVNYATANGSATGGTDYFAASGTVTFAAGQTSKPISIQVVGDTAVEVNESFFVNLSGAVNATLADGQAVGTILNDDALPSISISDITVNEGNSGTTSAVFNVTLSSASAQMIDVNYATANGSATGGTDYFAASGTVTFAAGQTSKPISIQVVGDTAVELNESFFVNLSGAVNATLADGQAVGTILNDDVSISYFGIPVYFHVIQDTQDANNDGYLDGHIDESRLDAQIIVLNEAFNGATGPNVQFFFWKAGVTRDFNRDWFTMKRDSPVENEAKRMRHQGGANALNFYTISSALQQEEDPYPIGWGTLPEHYASNSCQDGVVVPFTTLPEVDSNPGNPYNAGDLPVHEVGHWLGLLHTFHVPSIFQQDDCEIIDDKVADTPAHKNSNIGQCVEEDTCPSKPGTDPIHNFMTNTSDLCKSEFTRGQFERMADQYRAYRESSSTPQPCPVASVAWVQPSESTWGPPNTLTVAGHALNGSGGVELWWRDVTEDPVLPITPIFNRVEWQPAPNPTDHTWSNTIPSANKGHTFEVYVIYSGYRSRHFTYNGSTARYYEIVAKHSGKCLDVEGESTGAGARVIQFGCGGWANQQWQIIPVSGGYNKIVARHSGKVLDVQWGALDNGTAIWQWDENGTAAQQWQIIDVGGGYVRIMARHSGKALDVAGVSTADGAQIHQWDYVGIANQQWLLRPVP